MNSTKQLTEAMIKALAYASTHKGLCSVMHKGNQVQANTCKALVNLGLFVFNGKTPWIHGEGGGRVQYKLTQQGKEIARIGRMLRAFSE